MKEKKSGQLRIAMLGHKRIPSREGGIEIVVEEIVHPDGGIRSRCDLLQP